LSGANRSSILTTSASELLIAPSNHVNLAYPWYEPVDDGSLEQGDLLERFPVLMARPVSEIRGGRTEVEGTVREYDVVVLTQSCDLVQGKVENVLVCPHYAIEELASAVPELAGRKGRERIRQGVVPSLHLIPPCRIPGYEREARVVNFRQIATMPFDVVRHHAQNQGPRIRLLPPYREHLAQAFARFIMRVGLPVDFPDL
jgi:hypothetical protein